MANRKHRDPTHPEPGTYLVSLAPGAWAVGAHITLEHDGRYLFFIDSVFHPVAISSGDLEEMLARFVLGEPAPDVLKVCIWGKPCDQATYDHRLAIKRWAEKYAAGHPSLRPREPINLIIVDADQF